MKKFLLIALLNVLYGSIALPATEKRKRDYLSPFKAAGTAIMMQMAAQPQKLHRPATATMPVRSSSKKIMSETNDHCFQSAKQPIGKRVTQPVASPKAPANATATGQLTLKSNHENISTIKNATYFTKPNKTALLIASKTPNIKKDTLSASDALTVEDV